MRQSSVERRFKIATNGRDWPGMKIMPAARRLKGSLNTYTNNMSRESDDNLSSINSAYTDMYQETVKRFTRSSLSPEMDRHSSSPSPMSTKSGSYKNSTSPLLDPERRLSYFDFYDFYVEATGRRRSSDHGAVLTVDTEQFIIGQRVWVGGIRPGQIAYIGETHFAPGEWAGIVLDEPNGKNDGCVAGKRYFQCEPKRGIFSRLTRLTLAPLPGAIPPTSPLSKYTTDRSHTVSPTASIRSSIYRSPGKNGLTVGDRVIVSSGFGSRPGLLRYLGETRFASGNWCGVELDEPSGKNDGSVDGFRYFECQPKYGVFVPIAKVSLSPSSKKSRLSRAGSRESLTSIGTMNSIATTNTSRLRMSAQRKPSSIKPLSTPKNQFSMQDLLREKQNHIEQLMIERDLDREDAQNQALQFQKNISELQSRIAELERKLTEERKKTEDLQFSIDEATFCGDELNAQTQVYKEKIQDLEQKIHKLSLASSNTQDVSKQNTRITEATEIQISQLTTKLSEQESTYQAQIALIKEEEQRLLEQIKYLQDQNEVFQKELLEKDASLEKFSLSESGIENLRIELALLKQENERERQQTNAEYEVKLSEQNGQLQELTTELTTLKNNLALLEGERSNVEDECEILRAECKTQNQQLHDLTEQMAKSTAELSVKTAESATLEELLKAQQMGGVHDKTALEQKNTQISKLREENAGLEKTKASLEAQLQTACADRKELLEKQQQYEETFKMAENTNQEKTVMLKEMEKLVEELKQQLKEAEGTNEKLEIELKKLESEQGELRMQLKEQTKAFGAATEELQENKATVEKLQQQIESLETNSEKVSVNKTAELESLNDEIRKQNEKLQVLELKSTAAIKEKSLKIHELETQIVDLQQRLKANEVLLEDQRKANAMHESTVAEKLLALTKTSNALESTTSLLQKLQDEYTSLQSKSNDLEQELKRSTERLAQQELEMGDSQRKYESLQSKSESYASQNESLQKDILSARTGSLEMQATVQKLNEELAAKQKAFDELQNESNIERFKLENQIGELNQKLINSSKDCEELKENVHKLKEELSKRNDVIIGLEEKTVKQELSLSDAVRQKENLQSQYEALATQNSSLQFDLTNLRSSSTDSNEVLLQLSQDVAAKQKAYEELLDKSNAERSGLESQLQSCQQRIDTLCSQVEALTQELKVCTEESFRRFEQLKQAEEKCSKKELDLADVSRKLESLETKTVNLEAQNASLQNDLSTLRLAATDSNSAVLKLTEEVAKKQKALEEFNDKANAESLIRESRMQELTMRLESAQAELENLRKQLQSAAEDKLKQAELFESSTMQIRAHVQQEVQSVQEKAENERKSLCESFEEKLKNAEVNKGALDEAVLNLQQQIEVLQDELLKSQLDFKTKEGELSKQLETTLKENENLKITFQQLQTSTENAARKAQEEKIRLEQSMQKLNEEVQRKEEALHAANDKAEQIKLAQNDSSTEMTKLEAQLQSLENALEQTSTQVRHQTKISEDDKAKINELKTMLEAMQVSNANMSTTNAELSAALKKLENEKCEIAHNFELFEIEADRNVAELTEKRVQLEEELSVSQQLLEAKIATLTLLQNRIEELSAESQTAQRSLTAEQTQTAAQTAKLSELQQINQELCSKLDAKEALVLQLTANQQSNKVFVAEQTEQIKALNAQLSELQNSTQCFMEEKEKYKELLLQLDEYKKIIDEMDESSSQKTSELTELQHRVKKLELKKQQLAAERINLSVRLENIETEKQREVCALQGRLNDLQSSPKKLKENGQIAAVPVNENDDSSAQINFLNSIIADMQKKNDTLKARIEALESIPTDFTQPNAFDALTKRKPAPRVFCDICDVFDQHETEDCPLQASSDREYTPPPTALGHPETDNNTKQRKLPEPRKYCESCEVFGHAAGECDEDECY